jgi:hypothetical protein
VDTDATDVCSDELDLPHVDAGANLESLMPRRARNRCRTMQCACSSTEQREHSVTRRLDLTAA